MKPESEEVQLLLQGRRRDETTFQLGLGVGLVLGLELGLVLVLGLGLGMRLPSLSARLVGGWYTGWSFGPITETETRRKPAGSL